MLRETSSDSVVFHTEKLQYKRPLVFCSLDYIVISHSLRAGNDKIFDRSYINSLHTYDTMDMLQHDWSLQSL